LYKSDNTLKNEQTYVNLHTNGSDVHLSTDKRTIITLGSHFINPSGLQELLNQTSQRSERFANCVPSITNCPCCRKKLRVTRSYYRKIDHLSERVVYRINYSYCDFCKRGFPNLPSCVLPNINVGLDVLGHVAYWHILKQQSFSTLKIHLRDCHGILRDETTIARYVERFSILSENTQIMFNELIRAYLASQKTKFAVFDEAFFNSLYNKKLCLALFLLPNCRVIAGINVTYKRNHDFLEHVMQNFQQKMGELDAIAVDMSPFYSKPISVAFTAVSVQFCVFHFFQLIFKKIIHPAANKASKMLQKEIKSLRAEIKSDFGQLQQTLPGKYFGLCRELESRIQWCLKRKWINYILIEIQSLRKELQKQYSIPIREKKYANDEHQALREFKTGLINITRKIRKWETKFKKSEAIQQFQELIDYVTAIRNLFQETQEESFKQKLSQIQQTSNSSINSAIHKIAAYLQQYQENMSIYLQSGMEKTTSLIEQVFQRLKKTTANYRGGHYELSMQKFVELYRFFWNTEPIKLRDERNMLKRSPLTRMSENTALPIPIDTSTRWWGWLLPLEYSTYRKRVKRNKKLRNFERITVLSQKPVLGKKELHTRKEKAKYRWQHSKTLFRVREYFKSPNCKLKPIKNPKLTLNTLFPRDRVIYKILREQPSGVARKIIEKRLELPRTVVYESLERLESAYLIIRKNAPRKGGGKTPVIFAPLLLDNG